DRGYGSEIATFQEEGVHSLISGNLMDVCPVGAITTRDYRFKSRPWDNPNAADTICTQCEKGCNVTVWIKAKPEWAKGSQLVRVTPRFNPDVNNYWMCDIGRFNYHWIEREDRIRRPLQRDANGVSQPVSWHDAVSKVADRLATAGVSAPDSVRFLLSAHASHEELFLFRRITEEWLETSGGRAPRPVNNVRTAIDVAWRYQPKDQPEGTRFKVPPVDAPNVNGARLLGLAPGKAGDAVREADLSALKEAVGARKVAALYVFDPGPDGSLGPVDWIIDARKRGTLPLLIVQGVLLTNLARAADFVLPGASYVEKEASYTNGQGRLQGTARAIPPPGDAMEDWQILVNLGVALGVALNYANAAHVRADIAARFGGSGLEGITALTFGQPVPAHHWLQASNPSERWKWDFMFQDLPPVKGAVDPTSLPLPPGAIQLKEVK
ncbi:MAG TPA: molybdopterin-dependent oxidoreductase, partial [Vicinamibacterales bacterium]